MPDQHPHEVARRPELDGVRGIAILAVLAFHFGGPIYYLLPFKWIVTVVTSGWAGVDLFFILSGFLITRILLESRGTAHYFRNFYARRILRIFPVYILVVGAFFWIALPIAHAHGKITQMNYGEQAWYWLFLENWRVGLGYNDGAELPHLWSVAVEEQFYLMWSVIVAFFGGRYFVKISVVLLVLVFIFRLGLYSHGISEEFIRQNTFTRLDGLLAGAILAASPAICRRASKAAPVFLVIGMVLLFWQHWPKLLFFTNAIAFATLVARAAQGGFKLLRSRVLRSFGKYSYAIYLFHFIIIQLFGRLQGRFARIPWALLALFGGVGISYGLAWLSWRWLEYPCLRLKRYFPHPDQVRPAEPVVG